MTDNNQTFYDARAWIEVDMNALSHNINTLRAHLMPGCELMAVVKADAYGLGAEAISAKLQQCGVNMFAVVTAAEGIKLRQAGLEADIIVLGYTHPKEAGLLAEYGLIQMIADGQHAEELTKTGHKLRVHIAIDTGMHRLGIEPFNISEIEDIFALDNLSIEGMASHFAVADSIEESDMEFTKAQYEKFFNLVSDLRERGFNPGKLHLQASTGIFNHAELNCDYARTGIALYGILPHNAPTKNAANLKPAVSIRARIAQVRQIGADESVSYGRTFVSEKPMKIATVCIGYADGIPRHMSGNGGVCIVRGRKVPIIGRICMDLLMIDVTAVDGISSGDVVTLMGRDGDEEIRCEDFAEKSGTITNDVLCRLGPRLPRIYNN